MNSKIYFASGILHSVRQLCWRRQPPEFSALYQGHARVLRRENRAEQQTGRYKNAELFWLDLPVRHSDQDRLVAIPRFTFAFIEVYSEEQGQFLVENAPDIERASGLEIGEDGWRQLMDRLTRFEGKPGQKENPAEPIWSDDRGVLTLRRTLTPAPLRRLRQLDQLETKEYNLDEPDWIADSTTI